MHPPARYLFLSCQSPRYSHVVRNHHIGEELFSRDSCLKDVYQIPITVFRAYATGLLVSAKAGCVVEESRWLIGAKAEQDTWGDQG